MTTPDDDDFSAPPGRFIRPEQAEVLRHIAQAREAVDAALPVRIFFPADDAARDVVVHFEFAAEDGWSVFGDVTRGRNGLVISRLEVRPPASSTGVTAGLLRKIPVGEILSAVRTKAAYETARKQGTRSVLGQEPVPGVFAEGDEQPRRAGRAPLKPELLREVAMRYIDENAPGSPPGAMKRLAAHFGKPEETVRNWVTRARRDGWLGPSVKGRTGAEAGPNLLAWLARAIEESVDVVKEANGIAQAYGATTARVSREAVRAYEDISERDLSHRMGLPPLETAVVAQILYGRTLSAELAERSGRPGASEDSAFEEIAREVRTRMNHD